MKPCPSGMSGIDALPLSQENKNTQYIPILVASANAHESDVKAGLAAGFDDYICKPLFFPEFLEKVDCFLKNQEAKLRYTEALAP